MKKNCLLPERWSSSSRGGYISAAMRAQEAAGLAGAQEAHYTAREERRNARESSARLMRASFRRFLSLALACDFDPGE